MNLARLLAGGAQVAGSTLEGFGIDRQRRVTDALHATKEKRDAERDRVLNALTVAQTNKLSAPVVRERPQTVNPGEGVLNPETGKYDIPVPALEKPAPKVNLVPVDEPRADGTVRRVLRPEEPGLEVPGPNNIMAGSAALKKQIASNRSQLLVIDDALAELNKNPDAVGLKRGVGEVIPFLGGVQDQINQRFDPEGVGARAQIANIGSLKLHDRSGAAVTISEFPRLKPFIPTSADTPDAIRTKLAKLREGIEAETAEIERSISTRPAGGAASGPRAAAPDPEFEALMAKYRKP